MGYSTDFTGTLKFKTEPSIEQLTALGGILGEDARDHPEWRGRGDIAYIDLQLADDYSGIEWNGAEKTYFMVEAVNLITSLMRQRWPEFQFSGSLSASGEDRDDRWTLKINDDGIAVREDQPKSGDTITCPNCSHEFSL